MLFAQGTKDNAQDNEIIFDNKRYRKYNNWINAGSGPAYNSEIPKTQFSLAANYSFHLKKEYFQAGVLLTGDDFGNYNNVQFHGCYGKRKETQKYNFAIFIGPSYTSGYEFKDSLYSSTVFKSPGLYAEAQFTGKIKYDVGAGPTLFVDVNFVRTIVGIRLDLYFSGAYKGNASDKKPR